MDPKVINSLTPYIPIKHSEDTEAIRVPNQLYELNAKTLLIAEVMASPHAKSINLRTTYGICTIAAQSLTTLPIGSNIQLLVVPIQQNKLEIIISPVSGSDEQILKQTSTVSSNLYQNFKPITIVIQRQQLRRTDEREIDDSIVLGAVEEENSHDKIDIGKRNTLSKQMSDIVSFKFYPQLAALILDASITSVLPLAYHLIRNMRKASDEEYDEHNSMLDFIKTNEPNSHWQVMLLPFNQQITRGYVVLYIKQQSEQYLSKRYILEFNLSSKQKILIDITKTITQSGKSEIYTIIYSALPLIDEDQRNCIAVFAQCTATLSINGQITFKLLPQFLTNHA